MTQVRSWSLPAIVLKRTKLGENDQVVTLLTPTQGKVTAIAKGVRKLTSSKASILEPGNHITAFFIKTNTLPLLTQAKLTSDTGSAREQLPKLKQLFQFLEIIDSLFPEGVSDEDLFTDLVAIRTDIVQAAPTPGTVKIRLENIVAQLGYQHPRDTKYPTLLEYVSVLADKPLRTWQYLSLNPTTT